MTPGSKHATRKANFFLVGAPKAGTTSVDRVLRNHPDVFLSPIKEPCHFCSDVAEQIAPSFNRQKRFDISSYLASPNREVVHYHLVPSAEDYARLFEGAGERRIVGECSTFYLSSKVAAKNIHSYNPRAKIVALLRNPLDRIRSHYEMDRGLGITTRPLLSLIEEELALGEDANWGNCRFYVGASRYSRQLQEFHRYFAPEDVCVLSFERMVAAPERELQRLLGFLGIASDGPLVLPFENKSRASRFPKLNKGLHDSGLKPFVAEILKRSLPDGLKKAVKSMYFREGIRVVSDDELDRLRALLRDEGLDLAWSTVGRRIPDLEMAP